MQGSYQWRCPVIHTPNNSMSEVDKLTHHKYKPENNNAYNIV